MKDRDEHYQYELLKQEYCSLQAEWNLRHEKIAELRKAFAIDADPARTFQLEKQIQSLERLQTKLQEKIGRIDKELSIIGSSSQINYSTGRKT
jgi:hypothetical protein